eukprot:9493847-Pyramimonas_sp.AAC.2
MYGHRKGARAMRIARSAPTTPFINAGGFNSRFDAPPPELLFVDSACPCRARRVPPVRTRRVVLAHRTVDAAAGGSALVVYDSGVSNEANTKEYAAYTGQSQPLNRNIPHLLTNHRHPIG